MKLNGVLPGVIVYTCLLQACIKNKMVDKAIEIFNDMVANNVKPDKTAYNTIVNGCIFSGKLLSACNILLQAIDDNIVLHEDVYNNVLRNFMINHKMTSTQKHEYATKVCNYISIHKILVNQEYLSQVLNSFVFVQSATLQMHQAQPYYHPQAGYTYHQHSQQTTTYARKHK